MNADEDLDTLAERYLDLWLANIAAWANESALSTDMDLLAKAQAIMDSFKAQAPGGGDA